MIDVMSKSVKTLIFSNVKCFLRYAAKGIVIITALAVTATFAPSAPSVAFIPFFSLYALIAMIGGLYNVVVKRLHRQVKLNERGELFHINRKWSAWMFGIYIAAFASAFFFVLDSPRWESDHWVLIYAIVPIYYIIFKCFEHWAKKEFTPQFQKPAAMKLSFGFSMIVSCVAYVILLNFFHGDMTPTSFNNLLASNNLFTNSPSALLSEAGLLSSFFDALIRYWQYKVFGAYPVLALTTNLISFAFIVFGLVNLFSFCLLSGKEVKREFQLLPTSGQFDDKAPIRKRYFLVILMAFALSSSVYMLADLSIRHMRETNQYTFVKVFVTEQANKILQEEELGEMVSIRDHQLKPLIYDYYEQCTANIDSYLNWYYGPHGALSNLTKSFFDIGKNMAREQFYNLVADTGDALETKSNIQGIYNNYSLWRLRSYLLLDDALRIDDLATAKTFLEDTASDSLMTLNLWQPLLEESAVNNYLFQSEGENDKEALREKLIGLIDASRISTLLTLGIVTESE